MAKGLRATSRKRNNAKLRATIFGPASDARTERLSAKLQEIASKPRPDQERIMEVDSGADPKEDLAAGVRRSEGTDDMDLDARESDSKNTSRSVQMTRPGRIERKKVRRKAKASIVFAPSGLHKQRMRSKGKKL